MPNEEQFETGMVVGLGLLIAVGAGVLGLGVLGVIPTGQSGAPAGGAARAAETAQGVSTAGKKRPQERLRAARKVRPSEPLPKPEGKENGAR